MKKLFSLSFFALVFLIFSCAKDTIGDKPEAANVPDMVKKAFQSDHSTAKDAKWYKSGDHFEAVYKENGLERTVVMDANGKTIATETQLSEAQIPAAIKTYLNENYNGKTIAEAEKEETAKGISYTVEYEIDGQEVELMFDAGGNYLGVENDDDDGDDDDGDDDDENEVEVNVNDLPQSIKDGLSAKYPGAELLEADKITHEDGSITYDVEFKKDGQVIEVMFDDNGKFLGLENDDDDDHDDDNDDH